MAFTFRVNPRRSLIAVSFALDIPSVIPAKAGTQSGKSSGINALWVPAFAGMTEVEFSSILLFHKSNGRF
jgi:hypothetical protein